MISSQRRSIRSATTPPGMEKIMTGRARKSPVRAQLKGRVGNLIDLPSHSDSGNLAPHRREEETNPKKAKVSLRENLPGRNLSRHGIRGG